MWVWIGYLQICSPKVNKQRRCIICEFTHLHTHTRCSRTNTVGDWLLFHFINLLFGRSNGCRCNEEWTQCLFYRAIVQTHKGGTNTIYVIGIFVAMWALSNFVANPFIGPFSQNEFSKHNLCTFSSKKLCIFSRNFWFNFIHVMQFAFIDSSYTENYCNKWTV